MSVTTIDLLRHGEPRGGRYYRGWTDDELTDIGWQQMQSHVPGEVVWHQVVTSPLRRCASFAEQLCRQTGLPLTYQPNFREIYFGDWEGKTAEQLEQENKTAFYAFYDDPMTNTPNQAESLMDFQQRVLHAWQYLLQYYPQRHTLVSTHAGVIRVILAHILNQPLSSIFELDVPLASIHRIEIRHGQPELTLITQHA